MMNPFDVKPECGGLRKPYPYLNDMRYKMECIHCGHKATFNGYHIRNGPLLCTCRWTIGSYSIGGISQFRRLDDGTPDTEISNE